MPKKTFPIKLYQMLQYIETNANTEQYNSIIAWQDHGRCFRIHDKKRLEEELLPLFFGTAKYQRIRRSLNNWNFRMILGLDNPDRGCYYHHQFLRSQSALCARIKRVVSSSQSDDFGGEMPFEEPQFHTTQPMPSYSCSMKSFSSSVENHYDPSTNSSNTKVSKEEKRGNVISFESDLLKRRYEQDIPLESQVLSFLFSFMPYSTVSKEVPILPVVPTITTNLHILTSTPTTVKEDELLPRLNLDDANDDMHIGIDPHAFEDLPEDPRELCHVFD